MIQQCSLYFIPQRSEFLKIQPGTGDNLSPEDVAAGFTDYVIWNRFRAECLDIDGELPMECVDSGMVLIKGVPERTVMDCHVASLLAVTEGREADSVLKRVLEFAYGDAATVAVKII